MKATLNSLKNRPGMALIQFDHAGEMLDFVKGTPAASMERMGSRWHSGETWESLSSKVYEGDKNVADRAKAVLAKINAAAVPTVKRVRQSRPFGRAVTGAYLSSDPMPCRARVKVKTDAAPLTVAVNVVSSAGAGAADMETRGTAIAALVQRMAALRPVRLVLCGAGHASGTSPVAFACEFPTTPIDTYRLAWLASSQGFARGLCFALYRHAQAVYALAGSSAARCRGLNIGWGGGMAYSALAGANSLGSDLGALYGGDLLYIPAAGLGEGDFDVMLSDPVKWVNEKVQALTPKAK